MKKRGSGESVYNAHEIFMTTPAKPRTSRCELNLDFTLYRDHASAALRAFRVKLALINAILMVIKLQGMFRDQRITNNVSSVSL